MIKASFKPRWSKARHDFKIRRGLRVRWQKIKLLAGGRGGSRVRGPAASWLALTVLARRATSIFKIARRPTRGCARADRFSKCARFGSAGTDFSASRPTPLAAPEFGKRVDCNSIANSLNARTDAAGNAGTPVVMRAASLSVRSCQGG
jgi:hypothetical protein